MKNPANHEHSIEQTQNNIDTVMKLSAGAAATSVAVTMLPGDIATPVADQLAEMSKYFIVILSALYLEKYLITLTGYVTFSWIVPILCVILVGYILSKKNFLLRFAVKIAFCSLAICLVIPISVKISDIIYETQANSVNATIDEMDNYEIPEDEDEGILDKITGLVTSAVDKAVDDATSLLSDLIESLAVMLTISCLIPILVFVVIIWMIKTLFNSGISGHLNEDIIKKISERIDD
jgi:cellobiose-specific phosphotransferase system component IIC